MKESFTTEMIAEGVLINLNPELSIEQIKDSLASHLQEAGDFYEGTDLYLNINELTISAEKLNSLVSFMIKKVNPGTKIYLAGFADDSGQKGLNKRLAKKSRAINNDKISFENKTRFVKGTLRSGQAVEHPHNLVILGDVNPGAEVRAGGNILVFGKLMGLVHAGVKGDESAEIVALKLDPTQIRIAGKISRPPEDEEDVTGFNPEKAVIEEERIIVEKIAF